MMGLIARLIFGFISFQTMTMISGPSQKAFKPNAYRMLVIGLIASLHVGLTESFNVQQRTRLPSSWTSHSSSRAADVADTATTHANIGGENMPSRRDALFAVLAIATGIPTVAFADDEVTGVTQSLPPVMVVPLGDTKQIFNEGRALEMQGNIAAAQRIYSKVTKMAPRFIYGWSNLGNTQVVQGSLVPAEESYTKAIALCNESRIEEEQFGVPRCNDLYVIYLNRGCLRLNNKMPKEALKDLSLADSLRGKPDAVILQNLARAREVNGQYSAADKDYTIAISMTSNEVSPFWLRSAMTKFQLGDLNGASDLLKRVENRFPDAPEVRAAVSTVMSAKGDLVGAQQKFLQIPDRQRLNYSDNDYLQSTIAWPPAAIERLKTITNAVGDS